VCDCCCQEEEPDEDETFNLVQSLKKVSIFYACHNMGAWRIYELLFECIQKAKDGNKMYPDEAVKYCISSALFSVLWGLRQVEEMLERGSTTATNTTVAQEVEALRARNQQLLEAMKEMLLMSPVQLFKEEAYVTICDFLILFCSQLASSPHLLPLVYAPDRALQHMLNDFIQSYVFIDEEIGTFIINLFQ
jgi:cohesin complex subunit SA-1/2